jgi:hypothetical protein
VVLGEREDRAAVQLCVPVRRRSRVSAGDVQVEDRPPEEVVADGATHDPRLLSAERLSDLGVIHL